MKILLAEDDAHLCTAIKAHLLKDGFLVDAFSSGDEAFMYALNLKNEYDLVILDRMLPVIDGLSILKAMRKKQIQIPVILISGLSQLEDKIEGLDNGADDYLAKPFHIRELSARVRALTRRPRQLKEDTQISYQDLSLALATQTLSCRHMSLTLTPKEFQLMQIFLSTPQTIFSREQLIFKVWGTNAEIESGNVDNYIYFLRKRLRTLGSQCYLQSVYGSGYTLEAKND